MNIKVVAQNSVDHLNTLDYKEGISKPENRIEVNYLGGNSKNQREKSLKVMGHRE